MCTHVANFYYEFKEAALIYVDSRDPCKYLISLVYTLVLLLFFYSVSRQKEVTMTQKYT